MRQLPQLREVQKKPGTNELILSRPIFAWNWWFWPQSLARFCNHQPSFKSESFLTYQDLPLNRKVLSNQDLHIFTPPPPSHRAAEPCLITSTAKMFLSRETHGKNTGVHRWKITARGFCTTTRGFRLQYVVPFINGNSRILKWRYCTI